MKQLIEAIQQTLPAVAQEWNTVKLPLFETLVEKPFAEYFEGKQTQEKTKMMSPILDIIFARHVNQVIPEFVVDEGAGRDYLYGTTPMECKITFGSGKSWSGNGYPKTPWHILLRFDANEQGVITHIFAMIVDLSTCTTKWEPGSKPKPDENGKVSEKTVNWYHLSFLSEDLCKLSFAVGSMQQKRKFLQPSMILVD